MATLLPSSRPAAAQQVITALAIDPVAGPADTVVNYLGVGFTPGGRVSILLQRGLGLIVDEQIAGPTGLVAGSFRMPERSRILELIGDRVEVFAIDAATRRETLPAPFLLTIGPALDYPLPNGHFFSQTNGNPLGSRPEGYQVVNFQPFVLPVNFFHEFQRLGSVPANGFPASRPFVFKGFVTQIFQKGVFQWRPGTGRVFFLNIMDELHDAGFDDFLFIVRSTPRQLDLTAQEAGLSFSQIIERRLALLDSNPAIRSFYFSVDDPLLRFGLPTSQVEDMVNHFALRLQRAVLQQWKVTVPWARAGEVTVANGGDIAKEVGFFPRFAIEPDNPPTFSDRIVAYSPRRGETVSSPLALRGDARTFEANVVFDLIDERGHAISRGNVTARAGAPVFGRFEASVAFSTDREQRAVLRVYEISPATGEIAPESPVAIPLTIRP